MTFGRMQRMKKKGETLGQLSLKKRKSFSKQIGKDFLMQGERNRFIAL